MTIPPNAVKILKDYTVVEGTQVTQPVTPPDEYHFKFEYRGITVHKGEDRLFGPNVDPYYVANFLRNPQGTCELIPLRKEHKHKIGEEIPEMSDDEWYPSGGSTDADGNPILPIPIFPELVITSLFPLEYSGDDIEESFPLLNVNDKYLAILSVWEMDGDQSEKIMKALSMALGEVGKALLSIVPVAGAIVIAIAAILNLASYLTGSEDDAVGDYMFFFDESELKNTEYRNISSRMTSSDGTLDWTLYFGIDSKLA
jgi:hypothetical protein